MPPRPRATVKFKRTVAKLGKNLKISSAAKKQSKIKSVFEAKRANVVRTTARKSTIDILKSKARATQIISSKKAKAQTKKLKKQEAVTTKLLKSRKQPKTSIEIKKQIKNIIKKKAEQSKIAAVERKQQKIEDIRLAADARMQIKNIQTKGRRLQLDNTRAQKTITSDRGVSELDIRGVSNLKTLTESTKPTSNEPSRTMDANTKGNTVKQKQSLLSKTSSETDTMKSLGNKETEATLAAKRNGADVTREQGPIKSTIDAISGSINTKKSLLKPDAPQRQAAVNKKNKDAADAMKTASNSESVIKAAKNNIDTITGKKQSADSGRKEESSHAASHEKSEASARQGRIETEASKKAAINSKTEAVLTDVGAANTKRATAENTMKSVKDGNTQLEISYESGVKKRASAEESAAQNEARIKTTESAEASSRNDVNDGTVRNGNDTNDVTTITSQRDTLQNGQDILKSTVEKQRQNTENSRPTQSSELTSKVKTKEQLSEKMRSVSEQHDRAVKNLESTMAERQRASDSFKSNDTAIKNNNDTISGAKKEISNDLKKKESTVGEHQRQVELEGDFKKMTDKQNADVREKGHTLDSLVRTEEILVKTTTAPEGVAIKPESTKANIHDISIKKEIAQKANSNRTSANEDINIKKGRKEDAESKLADETSNASAHEKKRDDEANNARREKKEGDDAARDRDTALQEMDTINKSKQQKELELKSKDTSERAESNRKLGKDAAEAEISVKQAKQKAGEAENSMNRAEKRKGDADSNRKSESENAKALKDKEDAAAAAKKKAEDDKAAAQKKGVEEVAQAVDAANAKKKAAENDMESAKKRQEELGAEHADAVKKLKESEREMADADAKKKEAENNESDAADAMRDSDDANNLDNFAESDLVKERNKLAEDIKALEAKLKKAESDAESYYPYDSEKRAELRADAENIRTKMDEMKARIDEVDAALVKKRAEMENLKKIIKEKETLNKEKSDLESELARNNEELNDIQRQMDENNKKTPPNADLDAELKARKKKLEDRNDAIKQRLKKIKERFDEIDGELEMARLKKEQEDAMRKKREEEDILKKLRKDSEDFDIKAKKRSQRIEALGGVLGMVLGIVMPGIINTLLTPVGKAPTTPTDKIDTPENKITPMDSVPIGPSESGAIAKPVKENPTGNVQTCYNNICTIQNLFCKKGSSEYLRGCKEGTMAGTADGKRDGIKDEKEYAERILPISSEEITNKLKVDTSMFSEIEKEAFCQQLENELQASGKNINEIYALYPECKVSSTYGTPYGPKPRKDPYGEKEYTSGEPNYGSGDKQEGGAIEKSSSQDYLLGYAQSYRDSYMLSYANAWALSKLNRRAVVPIVLKPPTITPSISTISTTFSGPSAPMRSILVKSKRAIDAEKIIRRLDLMLSSGITASTYGRFDALRASALATIAEEEALASLT